MADCQIDDQQLKPPTEPIESDAESSRAARRRGVTRIQMIVLAKLLRDSTPSTQQAVGREVGLSPATIRRYLSRCGSTYRQVNRSERQRLAFEYLDRGQHTTVEIAMLVSYSEPSAFYRAFRRWTTLSPRQYRRQYGLIEDSPLSARSAAPTITNFPVTS